MSSMWCDLRIGPVELGVCCSPSCSCSCRYPSTVGKIVRSCCCRVLLGWWGGGVVGCPRRLRAEGGLDRQGTRNYSSQPLLVGETGKLPWSDLTSLSLPQRDRPFRSTGPLPPSLSIIRHTHNSNLDHLSRNSLPVSPPLIEWSHACNVSPKDFRLSSR